jgi:hypothetical protein
MDPIILGIAVVNGIVLAAVRAIAVGLSLIFGGCGDQLRPRLLPHARPVHPLLALAVLQVDPYVSMMWRPRPFGLGYLIQAILIAPLRGSAMVLEPFPS